MLHALSRTFFHALAGSGALKKLASTYGMRKPTSFARRFIAGHNLDEAIAAARAIEARGMTVTLDYLGESVSTHAGADAAARTYIDMVARTAASGISRNISLKLTQLGLAVDQAACVDNMRRILDAARDGFFVRIDMEDSSYTERTLQVFDLLWGQGYRNVGVVLQAYLRRTEADVRRLTAMGARIRLVKGAYNEPKTVAHQDMSEVDAAFMRMMEFLLVEGHYPAIATHDATILAEARRVVNERGLSRDAFEFQMLYGVRRDLQIALVREGYRMRVYIPFGREWFPYFMRRLGERPANVLFVLRSIAMERRT